MSKKHLICSILCLSVLFIFNACKDDKENGPKELFAGFESTTMPNVIPWQGGEYSLAVSYTAKTRTEPTIIPWKVRVMSGEEFISSSENNTGDEAKFYIGQNVTEEKRSITVEISTDGSEWATVAEGDQEGGLVEIGGIYWAQGNITLGEYIFKIAEKPSELGMYFKHMSKYGILSEGTKYSGKAYSPEGATISLENIPSGDDDPCSLASQGKLRTPTFSELSVLYENADPEPKTIDDVLCWGFGNGKLYLPLAGACMPDGTIDFKNTNGGYRGSTVSEDGDGASLIISPDYTILDYNTTGSLSSVRCVRNYSIPLYATHTPKTLDNNAAATITVTTVPGHKKNYPVSLIPDYGKEITVEATAEQPTVELSIPENTATHEIVYSLYVDKAYSSIKITQPGLKNYALYVSHTPANEVVPTDAFTLTVNCESDMAAFPVEIKGNDGYTQTITASSNNPKAVFNIPAHAGTDNRVLSIWVNGTDTGKSITQESPAANLFSVKWSEGYLTVKNGTYVFAAPEERGLYFKFNSKYGMTIDSETPTTASSYSGTAYGPQETTISYADISSGETDPCSLVAPAGTWRMPTQDECKNLISFERQAVANQYNKYTDGTDNVTLVPSGWIDGGTQKIKSPTYIRVWTSTEKDATGKYFIMGGSITGAFVVTASSDPGFGSMVRCVRER